MSGIIWGLLAAVFVGVSDAVARATTQKVSISILIFQKNMLIVFIQKLH